MSLSMETMQEIELLNLFDLGSSQQGLKIHHEAEPGKIAAAARLFEKGMISQPDGGYLTDRGLEAAEHRQRLVGLLQPAEETATT